ncbi:MAG: type VI secretion system Vgr family protein, partial [Pyrinomonadaceae bacterium]
GTQTAVVVGPPGEEIFTDKYGRVKVQFHWDREGKYDEKSSCWVRVSQNWAGKRWGAMFIPRIGQEVIVDFIEGDPDRPIITGRVYNGASMPPYALPDEMTKSAIKTNSSKGGAGFNELRFEDKKGKEQIFIHAERNKDIRVKNDLLEWVGNDSHRIIKKKHYEKVEEKKHLIVVQDQIEKVEGDEHLIVVGDRLEKIDGKRHLKVGGNKHEKVGGNKNVDVASNLNEKVGQKVSMDAGMDIHQKAGMNYAVDAGMAVHIKAGMTCVIEAGLQLTIKAGASFIDIGPAGISIVGTPLVNINSGGAAGSRGGCSPTAPEPPEDPEVAEEALVADTAEPGEAVEMPPPKAPAKPTTYSPGALVLKQAAENGTPFCDI